MKYTPSLTAAEIRAHQIIEYYKSGNNPLHALMIQIMDAPEHLVSDDEKLEYLEMLHSDETDFDTVEPLIKKIVALAYKLDAQED
jgi:hypothetical protein